MKTLLPLIMTFLMIPIYGQEYGSVVETKREMMDKLSFLEGEWQGSGWYRSPDGTTTEFDQTEIVTRKAGGLVLLVEGKGTRKEDGELIHDALATISFDESREVYTFNTHLSDGRSTLASGRWEDDAFIWGFETDNGGRVKYTIRYRGESWNETGAYSSDGENWYPFIEMKLNRK